MANNSYDYYKLSCEEVIRLIKSNSSAGLTTIQAQQRISQYGKNVITVRDKWHFLKLTIEPFASWFVAILAFAALLSVYLGKAIESIVIIIILFINALIYYVQSYTANKLTKSLQSKNKQTIQVKRNGKLSTLLTSELVPGDIIYLRAGVKIPADARLIESNYLHTDESALTGESQKQVKDTNKIKTDVAIYDQTNMVFSGTFCSSGDGIAVVVSTGMNTEFGQITSLAKQKPPKSQLQVKIDDLTRKLILVVLVIALVTFFLQLLRGTEAVEALRLVLSLTVSAIPEGLPIAVVVVMIFGIQLMAKENALVNSLSALESLGQVTLIATDKTGTITQNTLEITGFWSPSEKTNLGAVAYKASIISEGKGDELDKIIQQEFQGDINSASVFIKHLPFDQKYRMSGSIWKNTEIQTTYLKGSVESILNISNLSQVQKNSVLENVEKFTIEGMRVIAFAAKNVSINNFNDTKLKEFSFAGIIALGDQIRPGVRKSVTIAQNAGIDVIMLTGDHVETANYFARLAGISTSTKALNGQVIEKLLPTQIRNLLKKNKVFGRVLPEHKYKIIESLADSEITAMTGDGINDVPALRKANVGIAIGSGTDAAKEIADIIIMDDDFSTIVKAIRHGRASIQNIKKMLTYVLATNLGEVFTIVGALVIGLPLPISALQILWINVVTDSFSMIPLGLEKPEHNLLKNKPANPNTPLLEKARVLRLVVTALAMAILTLSVYALVLPYDENAAKAVAFATLVFAQWANALNCRFDNKSTILTLLKPNWLLYSAIAVAATLQMTVMFTPAASFIGTQQLTPGQLGLACSVFIAVILAGDIIKKVIPLKQ